MINTLGDRAVHSHRAILTEDALAAVTEPSRRPQVIRVKQGRDDAPARPIGVLCPAGPDDVLPSDYARKAEALGFESIWVGNRERSSKTGVPRAPAASR